MTMLFVGQPWQHWVCQMTARRGKEGSHAGQDETRANVLNGLGNLQLLYHLLLVHVHTKAEEIQQINGKEIIMTKKYSVDCREIHLAAECPPGSRCCDPLFQLPPHLHDRGNTSPSSNRAGLREGTEGVMQAVVCVRTGASSSPLFLSTE